MAIKDQLFNNIVIEKSLKYLMINYQNVGLRVQNDVESTIDLQKP